MLNMLNKIGADEIKDILETYEKRLSTAEEKGLLENPKFQKPLKEIRFRINILKNILLCFCVISHFLLDKEVVFRSISKIIANLFSAQAGHEDEEKQLNPACERAISKHKELWEEINQIMMMFDKNYDFSNLIQFEVDLVNYLAKYAIFFLKYRELICKVD